MSRKIVSRMVLFLLFASGLAIASSTTFMSTWKNPNFTVIGGPGKKVATFVIHPDESLRLGPEETLAEELRKRGIDSFAGYTVLPGELAKDTEKAKEFLKKAGITGAVLLRILSREERTTYVPGTAWYAGPYYPSFWGYWNYGWTMAYSPGYVWRDKVLTIETLVYSVEHDQLVWAGKSETTNPKDVRKFMKQLVEKAAKRMKKDGLVRAGD